MPHFAAWPNTGRAASFPFIYSSSPLLRSVSHCSIVLWPAFLWRAGGFGASYAWLASCYAQVETLTGFCISAFNLPSSGTTCRAVGVRLGGTAPTALQRIYRTGTYAPLKK